MVKESIQSFDPVVLWNEPSQARHTVGRMPWSSRQRHNALIRTWRSVGSVCCVSVLLMSLLVVAPAQAQPPPPPKDPFEVPIGRINDEANGWMSKAELTQGQPEWAQGNVELTNYARIAWSKFSNLSAVVRALKRSTITFGAVPGMASSNANASPPTITLDSSLRGAPTSVIAQYLAHEAIHVIDGDTANASIDEEVTAILKEQEIYAALKKPGDADPQCDTAARLVARGGGALRRAVRAAYPRLPEHPPPPPSPKGGQ